MKIGLTLLIFFSSLSFASIDIGAGTSSVMSGRPAPTLALNWNSSSWGVLYRSVGVQTPVYAESAWTVAAYKVVHTETMGLLDADVGAGLGGSYILKNFRFDSTVPMESEHDFVVGPELCLKFTMGPVYLGFDTLLGLTSAVLQHVLLNFQDVSHVTIGLSF